MNRRGLFFLAGSLVCFALLPVGLPEHRRIAVIVGCVYAVLGILSLLDGRGRGRRRPD